MMPPEASAGLAPIDWAIVGVYLASMVGTGLWFARRQKSAEDFLLAGRRVPVWAAAISIVATSVSAATFLGAPQDAYIGNLAYLSTAIAALIAVIIVAVVFIPAFYRENVSTVYQFLGRRFGPRAARTAGVAFVLGRLLASGARLYMAAIPVSLIMWGDLAVPHLIMAVGVISVVSIAYTLLGGLSAVIWTEVPQALLFVGAAIGAIWVLVDAIPAPIGEIADALRAASSPDGSPKLTVLDTRWDPTTDFSVWSSLIGLTLFNMAVYATDQDLAQRMLSCRTAVKGAWSAILSNIIGVGVAGLFLVVGLLLWVFYTRPDLMGGAVVGAPEDSRQVFLSFILGHVPPGVRGLMLAGLFAAAMSSIASSMGAIASTVVTDFYRVARPSLPERAYVRASRVGVLVSGLALGAVACACVVWQERSRDALLPFALGVMLFAYTGLLAVFLAAVGTRRGTDASVAWALITGAACVALMQFGPLHLPHDGEGHPPRFSVGWRMAIGTAAAFLVCIIPARKPRAAA
jgi:SSS family transporter